MTTRKEQRLEKRGERVELLDDKNRFDQISSNHKTTDKLTAKVKRDYDSWFSYFKKNPHPVIKPDLKKRADMTWVGTYHEEMIVWVGTFYKGNIPKGRPGAGQPYKPNTLKIQLNSLAWVLLTLDKEKYGEKTRPLWNESLQIAVADEELKEENTMTAAEKKNWLCFDDIAQRRNDMIALWDKDPTNIRLERTRKPHLYALLLAFNTWWPPMRLDLVGMKFWFQQKKPPSKNTAQGGADAYLWQHKKDQWTLVINKDKVSGKFDRIGLPRAEYKLSTDIEGVTQGAKLQALINRSLSVWPNRTYVLPATRNPDKAMAQTGYRSALKWLFRPKQPGQNILRKAFVNEFYPKVSTKVAKLIADRMRHSVEVGRRAYLKVDAPALCADPDEALEDKVVTLKEKAPPNPVQVEKERVREVAKVKVKKEKYWDPVAYGKKYREKNQEQLKAKRMAKYQNEDHKFKLLRAKQVFALNAGYVKEARQSTIDRYDLKQHEDGTWY
jgi:hypothetical protein